MRSPSTDKPTKRARARTISRSLNAHGRLGATQAPDRRPESADEQSCRFRLGGAVTPARRPSRPSSSKLGTTRRRRQQEPSGLSAASWEAVVLTPPDVRSSPYAAVRLRELSRLALTVTGMQILRPVNLARAAQLT